MENEKELDLIDIIKIVWGWFLRFVWKPTVFVFKFVLKRWWLFVLAVITGIGIAVLIGVCFPIYTGMIVFRNNVSTSSDFINEVRMMTKSSSESKVEMFNISIDDANAIKSIWAHHLCYLDSLHSTYVVDEFDKLAENRRPSVANMFAVEIAVKDLSVFDTIQNVLLNYFNTSEYFVQQNKMRYESSVSTIEVLEKERIRLDSIGRALDGRLMTSESSIVNGVVTSQVINPSILSKELIRMSNEAVNMSIGIRLYPNVIEIVTPLKTKAHPDNSVFYTWKVYVIISVVLFYVIALLIVYKEKVSSFIRG